jgi:hypothetical protein
MIRPESRTDAFVLAALLIAFAGVAIVLGAHAGLDNWARNDADDFHLHQVQWFRENGLALIYPSTSATTPGFHWLLAGLAELTGAPEPLARTDALARIAPALLTGLVLALLYATMRSLGAGAGRAALLIAPFFASSYVWASAVFPVTESLAQVGLAAMALALARPSPSAGLFGAGALVATAARQTFWPATAALPFLLLLTDIRGAFRPVTIARMALAAVPATAFLAVFVMIWGGLSPPEFAHHRAAGLINPTPLVHAIMMLGVFGLFFLRLSDFADRTRVGIEIAACAALAGLIWLVLPLTPGGEADGRFFSVVWTLAEHSPQLAGRPVTALGLIFGGFFMIAVAWRRARTAGAIPGELLLYACIALAQAGQHLSWQRYVEPAALLFLAMSLARVRTRAPVGDAVLGLFCAGWFALSMARLTGVIGQVG